MKRQEGQRGFILISTLFLLVVVALLAAYMARLSHVSANAAALRLNAVRAEFAARAGMEWAQARIVGGGCANLGSVLRIEGFRVRVSRCTPYPVTEGPHRYTLYDVEVEARRGRWGSDTFVRRALQKTLGKVPSAESGENGETGEDHEDHGESERRRSIKSHKT